MQQAVEAGDQVVVGVNRSATRRPQRRRSSESTPRGSVARSSAAAGPRRAGRRGAANALEALEATAAGDGNLIPAIIEAVRARATVGEISDRLRVAWGEHRELITV